MTEENLQVELQVAKELARTAGAVILKHYSSEVAVEYKNASQSDPVTQADKDANELIVRGLRERFPEDGILAEESPNSEARLSRERLWCIDPLDGTREFIAKNGQFVVMIGLAIRGEARLGVVYQPTRDALYWGTGGQAIAEVDGQQKPIEPTREGDPGKAVMMVSRSHRSKTVTRVANALGVTREEPLGSVGLKVIRAAEGSADLYISVSNRTQEWDACAPEAILRAAGGQMTDCLGDPLRYNKVSTETPRGMLATNGALHAAAIQALRPVAEDLGWFALP